MSKNFRIILQLPYESKKALEQLAKELGLKPSQFIKMKILELLQQGGNQYAK